MKIQEGNVNIEEDITFGNIDLRELKGDLFTPPLKGKNRPAILLIHGGAWLEGDKSQLRGYAILLSRLGFVCFCCSYRLSHEALWPAQIQDINCAIRFLRANSKQFDLDPERIGVTGNSAGGHLSLMSAITSYDDKFEGKGGFNDVSSSVKAVCAIYAPTSIKLLTHINPLDNAFLLLMGDKAELPDYAAASPINYIDKSFPPCMLIHGSSDSLVKLKDSTRFYEELISNNVPAELHIYAEEEHAFDAKPSFGRNIADLQAIFFNKFL